MDVKSGNEVALIRWDPWMVESITLVDGRAFPSLEEAAGAFAVDLRKTCGVGREYSLERAHVMASYNVGGIISVKGSDTVYRTIWAHRLGDGALAVPHLRIKDSNGRPGMLLPVQFTATSSGPPHPDGPGWVGGADGWLRIKWDDGLRKDTSIVMRYDSVKAANLAVLDGGTGK